MTTIERLQAAVAYLDEPNRTPDKALIDYSWQPCYTITAGDARALLAHYNSLSAIYAHVKYRPESIGVAYHEWVETWKELNSVEQKAYHALTTPELTP